MFYFATTKKIYYSKQRKSSSNAAKGVLGEQTKCIDTQQNRADKKKN